MSGGLHVVRSTEEVFTLFREARLPATVEEICLGRAALLPVAVKPEPRRPALPKVMRGTERRGL